MIVIGTRGSALALTQSRSVAAALRALGHEVRLERILTQGDRVTHLSLDKLEGKGFFTKEIEEALLCGRVDVAVHSLKDLPGEPTPNLCIAATPAREDARDVLLIRQDAYAPTAPVWPVRPGALVGTSAVRRKAQLLCARPDLRTLDLRGNVPTRVAKLGAHVCDAVVLAEAGLRRLNLDLPDVVRHTLAVEHFVPAPGQGALALQCRSDDPTTQAALRALHDPVGSQALAAERGLLRLLQAGCHVPLGAHATLLAGEVRMAVFFGGDVARPQLAGRSRFDVSGATPEQAAEKAFVALLGRPQDAAALGRPAAAL